MAKVGTDDLDNSTTLESNKSHSDKHGIDVFINQSQVLIAQENAMRPLHSHVPPGALPTWDTLMKHSQEARVFRRAQAVREVVPGQTVKAVSDPVHFTHAALRKWGKRFAREGTGGLLDRPRSGRPAKMTGEIKTPLTRLVDQDPLQHGSIHSQWSCRELATVLSQQRGGQLGRERVRVA